MFLIGSRAAKYHFRNAREPNKDWDVWTTHQELIQWASKNNHRIKKFNLKAGKVFVTTFAKSVFEFTLIQPGSSAELFIKANQSKDVIKIEGMDLVVAHPTVLILIKRSHLHLPIKWEKNIEDYHFLKTNNTYLHDRRLDYNQV